MLLFFCVFINAQTDEPKFGDIDIADLQMIQYEKDTSAAALILFDYGSSTIELGLDYNFRFIYTRHCRIKIFDQSADHLANISIPLYGRGNGEDLITRFEAASYNLVDGKIVKSKLDYKDGYKQEAKYLSLKKYAFTEVKEGTILEYSYTISTDHVKNIRGWYFQSIYPTIYSQYTFEVPEFYKFRQSTKGYLQFDIFETTSKFKKLTYVIGLESYDFASIISTIAIKNAPAFIPEPNIDCDNNYIQYVGFEMSSVEFPYRPKLDITETWYTATKTLNEDFFFGDLLKNDGFVKDSVASVCAGKTTNLEKAVAIYNYVQKNMEWDEFYQLYSFEGLRKPFQTSGGNSSEINLILTLMLRSAGLIADPVVISTRDNGYVNALNPTINRFNSVLTRLILDGKIILLDATDKYCPFGLLPPNTINDQGRVINSTGGDWVDLTPTEKFKETKSFTLNLNEDGVFTGTILGRIEGYAAQEFRTTVEEEKNIEGYYRLLQEETPGLTINSFKIKDLKNISKPIVDTLQIELINHSEIAGDKILFKPLLFETMEKNIYTLEERKYPVDYNYPESDFFIFEFIIPEGYAVESMPENISMKLPDNSVSMSYAIQNTGKSIKLMYKFNITKLKFLPDEYAALKAFYDQMVKKHSEHIVLKKIS